MPAAEMIPEIRWHCEGCDRYIKAGDVRDWGMEVQGTKIEYRSHTRYEFVGSSIPGVYGCHEEAVDCGPVKRVSVEIQEQLVEWIEGKRAEDASS